MVSRRSPAPIAILAGSALLKLGALAAMVAVDPARVLAPDSPGYHGPALALLDTGTFSLSPDVAVPDTIRTPGYPAFLAGAYALFGADPVAAVALQILLSVVTIALVYHLCARLWARRVGLLAALLLALDVPSFGHSLLLLSDTLFALFVTVMLVALERIFREPDEDPTRRVRWAFALGISLGLATFVRPVSYYLAGPLAIGLLLVEWRRWGLRRGLAVGGVFILPVVLMLGGWQVRNEWQTGHSEFSQIEGASFLFYRAAGVVALRDGVDLDEAGRRLAGDRNSLMNYAARHPEEGLGSRWREQGVATLKQHPVLFLRTEVQGLLSLLLGPADLSMLSRVRGSSGPLGDLRRLSPSAYVQKWVVGDPLAVCVLLLCVGHLALVYVGGLRWSVLSWRSAQVRIVDGFLWGIAIYLVAVSAGPEAYARFRVPLMPVLVAYAAAGLLARRAPHGLADRDASPREPARGMQQSHLAPSHEVLTTACQSNRAYRTMQ